MSNEIIDGDAELGADGVLQGWCWNVQVPGERPVVEILFDDRIVATSVASRFREDLRTRKIGDGYYGFMATLSKSFAEAGTRFVVTAREQRSQRSFWRHMQGGHALPGDFPSRVCALRQNLSQIADSTFFRELVGPSRTESLTAGLSVVGTRLNDVGDTTPRPSPILQARGQILRRLTPVRIETVLKPRAALVIVADSDCNDGLSTLAAVAPRARELSVSLTLIDRGGCPETALAPSLFGNLDYIFAPDRDLSLLMSHALTCSRADFLIVVRNPPATLGAELEHVLPQMLADRSFHVGAGCVNDFYPVFGNARSSQVPRFATETSLGLQFAGHRTVLERLFGSLRANHARTNFGTDGAALQAQQLCVWDEPATTRRLTHADSAHLIGNDAA